MQPITSKEDLVRALRDAAEVEQQLMCEYLYAAYSLKRSPDDTCGGAQAEYVRRWCSTLYFVARQEMEHLSLANGMLTALGAQPWFLRPNFRPGLVSPFFTASTLATQAPPGRHPVDLPYTLTRYHLGTIQRFICGESPPIDDLPAGMEPTWCFDDEGDAGVAGVAGVARARAGAASPPTLAVSHLAEARNEISAGTVQELYTAIADAFRNLDDLFVPNPPEVAIPVEYNVFVFPVTDRSSALAAIDLIMRQGEGLQGQWTYESHFRHFWDMRQELLVLQTADPDFDPAFDLLENPQRAEIADELTAEVFDVANEAYVTLLYMLTGLYARFVATDRYPHLSTALAQMTFAPAMTMVVRSLAEILVRLPTEAGGGRSRTGPSFDIPDDDRTALLDPGSDAFGDIGLYLGRWSDLTAAIDRARARAAGAGSPVADDLAYVHQSSHRITANLRRIYQAGYYSKFVSI